MQSDPHRKIRCWLWFLYAMIVMMVVLGGITRLTGSGLSMVEWRPLFGALPPLTHGEWLRVFHKYQTFPQYQQVNGWMQLPDFQQIFFWEWFHRIWGRLIGVAFLLPFLWFWQKGLLRNIPTGRIVFAFVLGALQGALGWFMVQSGLSGVASVSHYRLAAHLLLALFTAHWIVWIALGLTPRAERAGVSRRWIFVGWGFVGLLVVQIIWGAFMAGSRAGYVFQTFPDMNGEYFPRALFASAGWFTKLFGDQIGIHFAHRMLAWLVLAVGAVFAHVLYWHPPVPAARLNGLRLAGLLLVQFGLGVATVLTVVAPPFAVLHQLFGMLLLTVAVKTVYNLTAGDVGRT